MIWEVKTLGEKQKIIIIGENHQLISLLKKKIDSDENQIFITPHTPKRIDDFDYYFFINPKDNLEKINFPGKKVFFIFINKKLKKNLPGKTVIIKGEKLNEQTIDKILWFFFSKTKENQLLITLPKKETIKRNTNPVNFSQKLPLLFKFLNKKNLFLIFITIFLIFNLIFIPFFLTNVFFLYQTIHHLEKEEIPKAKNSFFLAKNFFNLANKFYSLNRPLYLLFSLARLPDDLIQINQQTNSLLEQGFLAYTNFQNIVPALFQKNKTKDEKEIIEIRLKNLFNELSIIEKNTGFLTQKLIDYKFLNKKQAQLSLFYQLLIKANKILPDLKNLLASPTEKKFVIFFANNMELRPGGGFIGSLGLLKIKSYTIESIQVYDVYDIDGRLTVQVEPPEPIKKYLNLPSWFLRDSNFSPDSWENYQKATFFLEKSVGWKGLSGGVIITTTAVKKILEAFPPIYLADIKETITADNFYLKTQFYVEKNFFPGSIQKKSFLNSLVKNLIINLQEASTKKLLINIGNLLEEKQIVLNFDDENLEKTVEALGWAGRIAQPICLSPTTKNCLINLLFPYETNVGANKANFFVSRYFDLKIEIDSLGKITNYFTILFKNTAPKTTFLGQNYRNYFQLFIPENTTVKQITKDEVLINDFNIESKNQLKKVGFFLEIPPQKTTVVEIIYQLNETLPYNQSIIQLIIQKQIGLPNSDLSLTFKLPKNIQIINQNFFPLVKDQKIIYNASLSTDKIFFIQLNRYDQ